MNKKGFTLMELLAVIVLLGVLGVVIIPKVGDSITNSKNQAYEAQVVSIKKGVNDFLIDNSELISSGETITIKLGVIKQGGYLPIDIKNPITRKSFSNESLIKVTSDGFSYDISLSLVDVSDFTENINGNSPILVLNGDYVEYVNVNGTYEELWASAKSSTGTDIYEISRQINLNGVEVDSVDTSDLNTYNIIYSVSDDIGNTTSATRTVIVRDIESPVIVIPEETTLHVSEVNGYDLMDGVIVTDNYDTDVTVTIDSGLSNIVGKYVITYTAVDSNENQSVERRVINVVGDNSYFSYYAPLDYVATDGGQYIDLDYMAKTTTEIRLDIELVENENTILTSGGGYNHLIGVKSILGDRFTVNVPAANIFYYWVDKPYDGVHSYGMTYSQVTNRSTMILKSGTATFQGVTHEIETKTADNIDGMLLLGGYNTTDEAVRIFNRYDAKVYGFQIYEGETLIRNMVPCYRKSDGIAGLYDLVNNVFYDSDGTSDFIYVLE